MSEPSYIIDGARTPFLKSRNRPGPFAASDLATDAGRALLLRQPFAPRSLDEVILGCAAPSPDEVNIGRVAALRMGCGHKVPGWTVMRNCASGMQALDSAINDIRAGRSDLVLAGGVDALSRAPLLFSDAMVLWLSSWYAAKLRPFFDPRYGNVTAGNCSQITDGGVWLVIASERAVEKVKLTPKGRIVDSQWAALDPAQMGLGPVYAATPLLQRHGLGLNDLDAWEINEAFAAQVIACIRAWASDEFCRNELGLPAALGVLDEAKLNVDGGAIAIGHPVGASGARIVLHLLNVLERTGGRRGIAAICIGGGQGGAMLVERV